ncbi:GNAT family N-acetyltransferase [Phytoactinopolyspora alkaliphila]|uniref:GNAT family N-acetyltransferase n=1 Tax=Phytoactinopolyspora alkaliphila TaxID=1783498 RepID=A0A6N9YIA0_9ACTN|nr:GNAT family N-acetyltransferase [Phytoactinopolyspora alkaliphila]NED94665.1 GNAT family N-acetyltransferase [Phytoactinopolyspora alkaliphila]
MPTEWTRLRLDVQNFDEDPFLQYLDRARHHGIELTTMARIGDTPAHRHALYQLNKTCSADIPERGEFYTYDEYATRRFDQRVYNPSGVVLALDGAEWVGMAMTTIHAAKGYAFSEMTGVLAAYRGRSLALAMKVLAIRFAKDAGVSVLRTFHHPRNASAIAMNRKLGFVDDHQD